MPRASVRLLERHGRTKPLKTASKPTASPSRTFPFPLVFEMLKSHPCTRASETAGRHLPSAWSRCPDGRPCSPRKGVRQPLSKNVVYPPKSQSRVALFHDL